MHRILDLARRRERGPVRPPAAPGPGVVRARSLCVASGKGGTGKSVVAGSLGRLLARQRRTVLVDGDLGVGNAHILQGLQPTACLSQHLAGQRHLAAMAEPCGGGLDLVASGSGQAALADLGRRDLARLGEGLAELERAYGYLLMDCGAGISPATLGFARAADQLLLVVTPDLTSLTDAYALLKVLGIPRTGPAPLVLVNRAADDDQAQDAFQRLDQVARRFLGRGPRLIGWLPEDPEVVTSVNHRAPLVEHSPTSPAALALAHLAVELREALDACHPRGLGLRLAGGAALAAPA